MNRLNALLIWSGIFSFGLFLLILFFYVASIVLPVFLILIVFAMLVNLIIVLYKKYVFRNRKIVFEVKTQKKKPDIIDAEYEIIDDNKKSS